eukprot:scaffold6420_cov168-Amphora_coffeaeformis.AAC.9
MRFLFFLLLPACSFGWLLDQVHDHDHGYDHTNCGSSHVSRLEAALDQARMHRLTDPSSYRRLQRLTCDELCDGCIEIETRFHFITANLRGTEVLPHPTAAMRRLDEGDTTLTPADFTSEVRFTQIVRDQITVANNKLQGSPFRLRLVGDNPIKKTQNDNYLRYPIDYRSEMAETIGSQDLRILDVYLTYTVLRESEAANPPLTVGEASVPSQQLGYGMRIRYDTLPGGGLPGFDEGITFVHELGHWLGLYHTFRTEDGSEFGCEAEPNDYIDDTPAHQGDSSRFDCRQYLPPQFGFNQPFPDTCTDLPGRDPVLNYMNYVSRDECHTLAGEFTCNQIERMYYQWTFYRDEVTTCPPGEMEIEFALDFDREYDEENRVFLYELQGGDRASVLFDSDVDHDDGAFQVQNILVVDICLPQNVGYELVVTDSAGNGFSRGGEIAVYQNGQLLGTNSENFGSTLSINIPAIAGPTPSPVTNPPTAEPITPTISPTDSPTSSPTASPVQDIIEQTTSPVASPVATAAPTAVLVDRTNSPTMMSNLVDTVEPTILRTQPPKQPTRAPRPIKMMKVKSSGSMSKLGKSISRSSSMSMKLKSKSDTKKSKKKSSAKSSMNMDKDDKLSASSKSKGSNGPKGGHSPAPAPSRTSGIWGGGDIFGP